MSIPLLLIDPDDGFSFVNLKLSLYLGVLYVITQCVVLEYEL